MLALFFFFFFDIPYQFPKRGTVPLELLAGWNLQTASDAQADVLHILQMAKLMHLKREVLERRLRVNGTPAPRSVSGAMQFSFAASLSWSPRVTPFFT